MKALGAGLVLVAAALVAVPQAVPAARAPSVRALPAAPVLTFAGRGFVSGEKVTLTVVADRVYRARVRVNARGAFTLRFPRSPRCAVWHATARGSHTARIRFGSGPVDCSRFVDEGAAAGAAPVVGTGIAGSVRRGPTRPVCVAELPCDGPAAGVAVEITNAQGTVARTTTGSDGRFVVYLPPGSYMVTVELARPPSVDVVVKAGGFSDVNLAIDTGIR